MGKKLLPLGATIALMLLLTEAMLALYFPQRTLSGIVRKGADRVREMS